MSELINLNAIEFWLGSVAYSKSGSKSTQRNYKYAFSRFLSFVGKTADEILAEYKAIKDYSEERRFKDEVADYIKAWILSLKKEGLTNNSINVMVGAVQSFFKYNRIPIGFIPTAQRYVEFHNRDITRKEIADILNTSLPRDRAFYAVMAQSGLRPDTICKLKLKHVEYERLKLELSPVKIDVPYEIAKGKYHSYFTFIGFEAIQALNHYLKTRTGLTKDSYLFVKLGSKNKSMSPVAFSAQFNKTARMLRDKGVLDFEVRENKPSEIRLYTLRKFFKKHTHEAGEEFSEFWMGHKGKGVTDHYRTTDIEFHRKLYAEKAAPFLRIEARTPSETEQQIMELRKQLDERDKKLSELSRTIETLQPQLKESLKIKKELQLLRDILNPLQPMLEFVNSFKSPDAIIEFLQAIEERSATTRQRAKEGKEIQKAAKIVDLEKDEILQAAIQANEESIEEEYGKGVTKKKEFKGFKVDPPQFLEGLA